MEPAGRALRQMKKRKDSIHAMTGIIDVGGGTRGIYGCGVFDRCLDENIAFDYVIGVSAGSANAISYVAKQHGRNYVFYTEYAVRPEYMGLKTLLKTGSYIGLEYIYGTLTNSGGEYPLDYDAVRSSDAALEIVATDAKTGKPFYFGKKGLARDRYQCLMASSCVPVVCRPYPVNGVLYFDGGISDPIPYKRALQMGCDKLVVILTKPVTAELGNARNALAGRLLQRKYPEAAKAVAGCNSVYLRDLNAVKALETEGKALIVAPDDISNLKTLSSDQAALKALYYKGYRDATPIAAFLK